jgi:hypothetical protein
MKLFYLALLLPLSLSVFANGDDWIRQEEETKTNAEKLEEQRMEAPTSTPIGGARSGELEENESQKEQMRHDAEKQKFLYEYEDNYRRGL